MKTFRFVLPFIVLTSSINTLAQNSKNTEQCFTFNGKQINCSDAHFIKNGYWMYFVGCDPNKLVYAEGEYKNGFKNGKWVYRQRGSHTFNSSEVFYTNDGAIIIEMDGAKLRINSDSTLVPDYSNYSKFMYRTWCNRSFGTNYYDCFLFNDRNQTPATYEKKLVYGFYNALNELLLGSDFSEDYLDCILEKSSDYNIDKWKEAD